MLRGRNSTGAYAQHRDNPAFLVGLVPISSCKRPLKLSNSELPRRFGPRFGAASGRLFERQGSYSRNG